MDWINNIFGGKSWYNSFTAWGLILFTAGDAAVGAVCNESSILPVAFCATATAVVKGLGGILTVLGLRRRLN